MLIHELNLAQAGQSSFQGGEILTENRLALVINFLCEDLVEKRKQYNSASQSKNESRIELERLTTEN